MIAIQFRRLICWLYGHRFYYEQHDTLLVHVCRRCRKADGAQQLKYTSRHKVTRGDIERRMREHCPTGYSFVDCNWKKRKAKFVNEDGALKFVSF